MTRQNTRLGIWLMILTSVVFALQDGMSRHLGGEYNVYMVVMIRFWFFAAFVVAMASRQPGGIRAATKAYFPKIQIFRGVLLVTEVCVMVVSFTHLGLIASHAVFTSYPLMIAALSGPVLGEKVGWRRWSAIAIGFIGVLIILKPGFAVFSPWALVPLLASLLFALYGLLTRYVGRRDTAAVSFFWTGSIGALAMTPLGLYHWEPMTPADWGWMAALCCTGAFAHYCLIKAYEVAEASTIQPFAFLQLVFIAILGLTVFDETITLNVILGAAIVVSASLFTLWRQHVTSKRATR